MKVNEKTIINACAMLEETLVKKNHDYGNSVESQFEEYGLTSILIRLDDKMKRLKNFKDDHYWVHESIQDTLLDLAGYATLAYIIYSFEDEEKSPILEENKLLWDENQNLQNEIRRLTKEIVQMNLRNPEKTPKPTEDKKMEVLPEQPTEDWLKQRIDKF